MLRPAENRIDKMGTSTNQDWWRDRGVGWRRGLGTRVWDDASVFCDWRRPCGRHASAVLRSWKTSRRML
jgi:hypothetical protein